MTYSIAGESSTWSDIDSSYGMSSETPLKWQDAVIHLGADSSNTTTINSPTFNLTLTNNIIGKFYNEESVQKYSLGRLAGTGSFFIPFSQGVEGGNVGLKDFRYGNDSFFRVYWGTADASTDGDFSITSQIRYNNVNLTGDVEIGSEITFDMVYDSSQALEIKCGYSNTKLIRGI